MPESKKPGNFFKDMLLFKVKRRTRRRLRPRMELRNSLDLIYRSMSDFAIHLTAGIIGEADSTLSRTRALLAPAKPVP